MQQDLTQGLMNNMEVESQLQHLMQTGDVEIDKSYADPHGRPLFTKKSKQAWNQKNKSKNPLSGKGKSYADRVEGPDGWGQHVPRADHGTKWDDDDLDSLW